MQCSTCGNDNEGDANFCTGCSTSLSAPTSGEAQSDDYLNVLEMFPILQKRAKIGIKTGGAWFLGGAIFTGVGYLLSPGGWYLIAFGPVIFGGYQMLRGLADLYSLHSEDANRWLLAVALVVCAVGALSFGVLSSGEYSVKGSLKGDAGDCLDANGLLVGCDTTASRYEIISIKEVPDQTSYPGLSYFDKYGARCSATDYFFYPTSETWDFGDRKVLCVKLR